MLQTLLLFPLVGVAAGLSAGLFGVGGGLVIVPTLLACFAALGFADAIVLPLAIGTSLATIVLTSISSIRAHHRLGNVDWPVFRALAPGIALGVVLGVNTVIGLPATSLKLAFGIFAVAMALQMGLGLAPRGQRALPGTVGLTVSGGVIGFVSAIFGIGGGSLSVPFLSFCNVTMQRAVATSAACGLPIAVVGAISNVLFGWGKPDLPSFSSGFVYWPAFFGIVLFSVPTAKLGAALAQRLPSAVLKRIFAIFMLFIGLFFFWQV